MSKQEERRPSIRFKGYTEPWEQRKLGEVSNRVKGNDGRMDLPTLTISAGHGWLDQKERFSGNIAGKEQKNYTLLTRGELSYNHGNSKLAKYGAVFQLNDFEEALVPKVYHSFKMVNGNSGLFIEYLFSTKLPDKELRKLISSGARMDGLLNITYNDFVTINLTIPRNKEEQIAIGSFFQELDQLITLQQRELDLIKEGKKTLLSKMFPKDGENFPEIRFPGFTNAWEQRKLGEVAERVTRKNKNLESELPLTISAQHGLINQETFFNKKVASKDVSGYYLLKKGEFAYNKSYSSDYPWGAVKRLENYEMGVLSTLYIVFRPNSIDSDFLAVYYDSPKWHKEVSMRAAEGARNHGLLNISPQDFFDTELLFPVNHPEQTAIGSFFQELDQLITLQQRELEMLKTMKSTLLKAMFA
ncbi:restriction endonuclease subunit S [Streptococcus oralis]|uniref:restriction endonuclease subunit S n=1 Tax=Streptococcus oralis TaxID=1303 RepID=UPI0020CF70C5|nr:restriction endonuclease subunit S [Streptococcus oralis]